MRNILFLSYYFPPMGMGGVQRSVKFVKYLPEFGWNPIVLTVKDVRYHGHDRSLEKDIAEARVIRAGSLDPLRLAFLARGQAKAGAGSAGDSTGLLNRVILPWLFVPDSKIGWLPFAVRAGLQAAEKNRIQAIFTTSPPHSAHLAGTLLRRRLGIPWIADFRDSWNREPFDRVPTPAHRRMNEFLLRLILKYADRITGVSSRVLKDMQCLSRRPADDFIWNPNGFDPEDFRNFRHERSNRFRITYSGTVNSVHPPDTFLAGAGKALRLEPALRKAFEIRFVGSVSDMDLNGMIRCYGLDGLVKQTGYVLHAESLKHLSSSDALLLVLPAESGPGVIPGKLYEYLASGLPILGVLPDGEAGRITLDSGRGRVVRPGDADGIASALIGMYRDWRKGKGKRTVGYRTDAWTEQFSRKRQTERLAEILNEIAP
ncbi:MAG: glycosyltransferase family 4 protein [bacterium]|nr:glycosyltransferase family 4 protein [bacterium]